MCRLNTRSPNAPAVPLYHGSFHGERHSNVPVPCVRGIQSSGLNVAEGALLMFAASAKTIVSCGFAIRDSLIKLPAPGIQ